MTQIKSCKACSAAFRGEHYKQYCDECYSTIRSHTTPFNESKHPALVYERQHPKESIVPATPEHIEKCLAEMREVVSWVEVEYAEPVYVVQHTCEHDFKDYWYAPQCVKCGMLKHQYFYSIEVEPCAIPGDQR